MPRICDICGLNSGERCKQLKRSSRAATQRRSQASLSDPSHTSAGLLSPACVVAMGCRREVVLGVGRGAFGAREEEPPSRSRPWSLVQAHELTLDTGQPQVGAEVSL